MTDHSNEVQHSMLSTADLQTPALSDAETRRRKEAVKFAHANVGLEGFNNSAEEEQWADRFIRGEITLDEFVRGR